MHSHCFFAKELESFEDKNIDAGLEVNSKNPGKLISDYNKSDHPLMDVLDLDKSIKLTNPTL